jgi:hypothetical protein
MALRPPCCGLFFDCRSLIFYILRIGQGRFAALSLMLYDFKVMAAMYNFSGTPPD